MTTEVKVSIIVPVYNAASFLEECLDSILSQTLKNIEVICVNDGSKDNSQAILERYAKQDQRVRVLVKENGGLRSARNFGVAVATGEYIGFVDSDDFIDPKMMEILYSKAKETNADVAIGDLYLYDHKTAETSEYRDQLLFLRLKNRVINLADEPELIRCIAAWDRIYRRSLLNDNNITFPEGLVYEDALYTTQVLMKAQRIVVIPQKLYYYRKNVGESITDREVKSDKYKSDFLNINLRIQKILQEEDVSEDILTQYLMYFMHNAFIHQGNATTPRFFKYFFAQMHGMMHKKVYDLVKTLGSSGWTRYARYLKKGQIIRCWFYFKARNLARRIKAVHEG